MSRIEVNIHKVNDLIPSFSKVATKISNTTDDIASISARLDDRVKSRRGIDRRLHQLTAELESMERKMQKLVTFLQDSMDEYSNAEEAITKQVNQYVEKIGVGKKSKEKGFFDKILDGVQVGLDVVGLIPVVGEIADGVNGSIYLARGDKLNAALSFAAMIPVVGSAATGAKYVNKGIKYGEEIADAGKTIKKPTNTTDHLNQDSADVLNTPIVTKKSSKGTGEVTKEAKEVNRTYTGDMMDPLEAARYDGYWRNLGIGSNATYDEFIKRNPKSNFDNYLKLVKEESPWPDGYLPKPVTLKSGYTFEMALAKGQGPQTPGRFGTDANTIVDINYVRNNLAVKDEWKPTLDKVVQYRVKDGVSVPAIEGPVGPQIDLGANKYLNGGANQINILIDRNENMMDYLDIVSVRPIK